MGVALPLGRACTPQPARRCVTPARAASGRRHAIRGLGTRVALLDDVRSKTTEDAKAAPTWSPKSSQEKWSSKDDGCNLHKARLDLPSRRGIGRVMPKTDGTRPGDLERSDPAWILRNAGDHRTARSSRSYVGPLRRDPRGTLHAHGGGWGANHRTDPGSGSASATGGFRTASRRAGLLGGWPTWPAERAGSAARECFAPLLVRRAREAWTRNRAPAQTNRASFPSEGCPTTPPPGTGFPVMFP